MFLIKECFRYDWNLDQLRSTALPMLPLAASPVNLLVVKQPFEEHRRTQDKGYP
jgi:hypothetical protein